MSHVEANFSLSRFLSHRIKEKQPDERAQMLALAKQVRPDISLGRGDPDLSTPPHIIQAGITALQQGKTHYTEWTGLQALREAIVSELAKQNKIPIRLSDEVIVTVGAEEAVFLIMQCLLDPGDEVIIPEPRYTPYDTAITSAGGKIISLPTSPSHNFQPDVDLLKKHITDRTKMLILINPNNPTGTVFEKSVLSDIAKLAKRKDIIVISDEIYQKINYGEVAHTSIAALPEMYERTLTINSFSKTYAMTGWRVGYIAGPRELIRPMAQIKYAMTISTPTVSQYAALAALTGSQSSIAEYLETYRRRRGIMTEGLDQLGIPYNPPLGAFYVFADIRDFGMSSLQFARKVLAETNVLIFPGTAFGPSGEGFVRISLLAPEDQIAEAVKRFQVLRS